jgi:adenylate kinase
MNILFLGPPGSGKGTQAKLVVKKLNSQYFESGDILREKAREGTALGQEIDRIIHQEGKYVPDNTMRQIVSDWITKTKLEQGIVFDGFPRTIDQYDDLQKILVEKGAEIEKVFYLKVSEQESVRRLSARRICLQCDLEFNLVTKLPKKDELCDQCQKKLIQRKDDSAEVIKKRLKTYYQLTKPLIERVRQQEILEEVDGERPIGVIHRDIVARLGLKK